MAVLMRRRTFRHAPDRVVSGWRSAMALSSANGGPRAGTPRSPRGAAALGETGIWNTARDGAMDRRSSTGGSPSVITRGSCGRVVNGQL